MIKWSVVQRLGEVFACYEVYLNSFIFNLRQLQHFLSIMIIGISSVVNDNVHTLLYKPVKQVCTGAV